MGYGNIFKKWYFWLAVVLYASTIVMEGVNALTVGGIVRSMIIGFIVVTFFASIVWVIWWIVFGRKSKKG